MPKGFQPIPPPLCEPLRSERPLSVAAVPLRQDLPGGNRTPPDFTVFTVEALSPGPQSQAGQLGERF